MGTETIRGRYRLVERIGVGAMSEVWRAEDTELDRTVAVKLLRGDADRARFEREARAVAALSHPAIIRLFDHGEAHGRPYLVLEYLPGGSLHERLRTREPLPDDETEQIVTDVAGGLAHAHAHDVVHRDVKPANVLFDAEGRAKLADFGIAKVEGARTLTDAGTVMGTAAFISPEQASGDPVTTASDVYSFGVILFRLLTGRLPFEASDPMALALQHVEEPAPLVRSVRPDAPERPAALADACLVKDPARRPPDGTALLQRLGSGPLAPTLETAATIRTTPVTPPPRPPRGRGRLALLLVGLALLAAAGIAAAVLATRSDSPAGPATTGARPGRTVPSVRGSTTGPSSQPGTTSTSRAGTTAPATTSTAATTTPPTTTAPPTSTETGTTTATTSETGTDTTGTSPGG